MYENYSPFVKERETLDNGFSAGWGFHFRPSEEYVIDCHAHSGFGGNAAEYKALLDKWFEYAEPFRLQKIVLLLDKYSQMEVMPELMSIDERVQWMLFPRSAKPCPTLIRRSKELGACGLKLHNYDIMKGLDTIETWNDPRWQETFEWANAEKFPILWHVTQRTSYSPYHGGGNNAYFSEGQKRGSTVTNQMLLDRLCDLMRKYPELPIIGAHQMYLGLPKLSALFDEFENLYIDTSVGFYLRWCDDLNDDDRRLYHDFFLKYYDRILFGTDTDINVGSIGMYQQQTFMNHLRFIHKLDLPYDILQAVLYKNSEKMFGMPPSDSARKYNTRP